MASRQRRFHSRCIAPSNGREIMRPIISSDIMGNRNVEIVPVGAWVEPADDDFQPDALRAAQIEEEKIRQIQNEKENRLRTFQRQTKHRVNKTNLLKRQQQIQEAEQAFEIERKVVQQSYLAGDMPRKDTCMVRQDLDSAIRKRLLDKYGEDVNTWEKTAPVLHSHAEESHQVTDKARRQLTSKKIVQTNSDANNCNSNLTAKTAQVDIRVPAGRSVVDVNLPDSDVIYHKKTHKYADTGDSAETEGCVIKGILHNSKPQFSDKNDNHNDEEKCGEEDTTDPVTYQCSSDQHRHKKKKRQRSLLRPKSAQMAAILLRDSESDILARQRKHQAAVARKIFMDRERETVRENIRRQQHRKKIEMLKKEKENYRQELEDMAHKKLASTDSPASESDEEVHLREQMEALQVQEINKRKHELKKAREMKRYLNALRHTLLEKVMRRGVQLPSLCACGDTVWDTHPDTCANNCFFYKNPRAYARALQSLLSSAEVM